MTLAYACVSMAPRFRVLPGTAAFPFIDWDSGAPYDLSVLAMAEDDKPPRARVMNGWRHPVPSERRDPREPARLTRRVDHEQQAAERISSDAAMDLRVSRHARERSTERAIQIDNLPIVLRFGSTAQEGRYMVFRFDQEASEAAREEGIASRTLRTLRGIVLIVAEQNVAVTTWRDWEAFRSRRHPEAYKRSRHSTRNAHRELAMTRDSLAEAPEAHA